MRGVLVWVVAQPAGLVEVEDDVLYEEEPEPPLRLWTRPRTTAAAMAPTTLAPPAVSEGALAGSPSASAVDRSAGWGLRREWTRRQCTGLRPVACALVPLRPAPPRCDRGGGPRTDGRGYRRVTHPSGPHALGTFDCFVRRALRGA